MKYNMKVFFKRNWIYLLITIVFMIVIIKQTSLSFIFNDYNVFTSFIFEKVDETNKWFEIIDIFNNLGFAYCSSYLFYLVVDYFPTRAREKKAYSLLKNNISDIIEHLSGLFCKLNLFINYIEKTNIIHNKEEFIKRVLSLRMTKDPIYCDIKYTNTKTGEIEMQSNCEEINSYDSIRLECKAILEEISIMKNDYYFGHLESNIIETINLLQNNRYINNAIWINDKLTDLCSSFTISCQSNDIEELIDLYFILIKLPINFRFCSIKILSESEVEKKKKEMEKLKNEHPEWFEMLDKINEVLK